MPYAIAFVAASTLLLTYAPRHEPLRAVPLRGGSARADAAAAADIEVYSTPGCSYCAKAKRFLKRHSLPYLERDVSVNGADLQTMIQRANSATLPQIFIAGQLVGGCEDMLAEHSAGKLEPRLAAVGLTMVELEEADAVDDDAPPPMLRSDGVLNPWMGGGGGAAAETAAELQRCMLSLMDEFVSERGVRYGALRTSPQFANFVMTAGELGEMDAAALDGGAAEAERKAFWINLYNCLVLHGTVAVGAPSDPAGRKAFFGGASGVAYRVAGRRFSLDDIEHGVLRCNTPPPGAEAPPFGPDDARLAFCLAPPTDPRLHFALNCGAKSCPPIKLYSAANLEEGLDLAARAFVESDLAVDAPAGAATLSKILDWYGADFGPTEPDVLRRLQGFVPEGSALHSGLDELLRREPAELAVTYREYDWGLNTSDE